MTRNVGHLGILGSVFMYAVILAACSDSSTPSGISGTSSPPGTASTTISGTAAAGAPLVGTITVKDSKGAERSKTIDLAAAGAYSIDVTGLTAPFLLRASGTVGNTSLTYFSGTASVNPNGNGNVNITPLTDLIIGNIAGQIAKNFYDNPNFSALTTDTLNAERDRLRDRLKNILQERGVDDSFDLLRSSFKADHSGLDLVLDTIRVTPPDQGTVAKIKDLISQQEIEDDLAKTDTTVLPPTGNTPTTASNFQQIADGLKTLENLFATSVPAADNAQLLALFDTQTFKHDGVTFAEFTTELLTAENLGVKFPFTLKSLTPSDAPTNAKIMLTVSQKNRIPETFEWQLNKVTVNNVSTWRAIGNQWVAGADVQAYATNFQGIDSGLWFGGMNVPPRLNHRLRCGDREWIRQ